MSTDTSPNMASPLNRWCRFLLWVVALDCFLLSWLWRNVFEWSKWLAAVFFLYALSFGLYNMLQIFSGRERKEFPHASRVETSIYVVSMAVPLIGVAYVRENLTTGSEMFWRFLPFFLAMHLGVIIILVLRYRRLFSRGRQRASG